MEINLVILESFTYFVKNKHTMKKTLLEKLDDKQYDAYVDYRIVKAGLEVWKGKNPTYKTDLTLWVESMNLEILVEIKKHKYDIAKLKCGIESTKQHFAGLNN